jgi:K+-sensing histidine kinase KdpD
VALLDYNRGDSADGENVREASMLCAPLVTRDSLVGVLKIAARYPEQLKPFDAELVEHFRSQAAIAIQNLHRTESLRARVVTAERKHAMADLATSVSHDVNNALGSMLPLIQQMQSMPVIPQSYCGEPPVHRSGWKAPARSCRRC